MGHCSSSFNPLVMRAQLLAIFCCILLVEVLGKPKVPDVHLHFYLGKKTATIGRAVTAESAPPDAGDGNDYSDGSSGTAESEDTPEAEESKGDMEAEGAVEAEEGGAEEESEGEAGLNQESEEALSESEDDVENEGPSEQTVEEICSNIDCKDPPNSILGNMCCKE